jgi:hypothetical protein
VDFLIEAESFELSSERNVDFLIEAESFKLSSFVPTTKLKIDSKICVERR